MSFSHPMKAVSKSANFLFCLTILASLINPIMAKATPGDCLQWAARVVSIQGQVEARAEQDALWTKATLNDSYCQGDIIHVGNNSRAALELNNDTIIRLDQLTTIVLTSTQADDAEVSWLELLKGAVHFITRVPRSLKIKTPYVNASVEGTEFVIRVDEQQTQVSVIEGEVIVENDNNRLVLQDGQSSVTDLQMTSSKILDLRPQDAIAWSLYYPALLDQAADNNATKKPQSLLYNAHQLLMVGRATEAEQLLATIINDDPNNAEAYALRSIIMLTQNKLEQAEQLIQKAQLTSPHSVAAWLAKSYLHQAHFEHSQALTATQRALELAPDNYIALTHQAELMLALGNINKATTVTQRAIKIKPKQGRAYTLQGFVKLHHYDTDAATQAFNQAMQLDQADPLPRMGLGLTQIRQGQLAQGRRTIEIAALLHPGNALIRSYLGKAYYEEQRDELAGEQFSLAKILDPHDPTSWFYNAILKQRQHNPIAALNNIQASISRNDNRAIYRSKLLLDQDLAARSASLARIYQDLDFRLLALNEGWKSAAKDPANHSAHRFLADSYAALPRHEIARISELLQAQLLQPLNLNPIQPQLSASNLGILDGAGPSTLSSNEFNPLFTRNRTIFQANILAGDHETNGHDVVISALSNKLSYSLGQFTFRSQGYRANNDQDNTINNLFIQGAISHQNSLQFELRQSSRQNGDLSQLFDPSDYSTSFQEQDDVDIYRLGFKHAFGAQDTLLASLIKSHQMIDQHQDLTDLATDDKGVGAEIQYLKKSTLHHQITGLGFFEQEQGNDLKLLYDPFTCSIIPTGCDISSDTHLRHSNAYLYSYYDLNPKLNLTLAISIDDISEHRTDNNNRSQTKLNPKLGLIWQINSNSVLRAAAFRAVKRTLIANQTIEPTQIAGFNQFFDDLSLTNAEHYGLAFDTLLNKQLYTGVAISHRELDNPYLDTATKLWLTSPTTESNLRAYGYLALKRWLALTMEIQYEQLNHTKEISQHFLDLDTLSLPIGISFFTPSGTRFQLKSTYVDQQGIFYDPTTMPTPTITPGQDRFNIIDAELDLQIPYNLGQLTFAVKNLDNTNFQYHDVDKTTPRFIPERHFFMRLTLNFS